ncbi:Alb1-domain-containing protein [Coniochaeta sp. 2T2.1]|nr:Alb1-domain-containing protein [Coniochaeta sp. 2T2.1]
MAKAKKALSAHSRAARRATSPGIDTDKSLKNVQPPAESINIRPAVLAAHHNSGVTKTTKKRKSQPSHKARLRAERNAEKGEAIAERTALKVQKSKGQARVIQSRKKTWDELNREILGREEVARKKKSKDEAGDAAVAEFYGDDDEEMDGAEDEAVGDVSTASVPVPAPVEEEEEIL